MTDRVIEHHWLEATKNMLIVKRQVGEQVRIGKDITLTVLNQDENGVYLGIDAPVSMQILRLTSNRDDPSAESAGNEPFHRMAG